MNGQFIRRLRVSLAIATLAAPLALGTSATAETITYLFPAPPKLPAFGPIILAQGNGYLKAEGIEMKPAIARGGVDVAKQLGAGNAPIGGVLADSPIIVRPNGVPIKSVAVFGGRGFMQLVVREDSGIRKPADLKGKTITAMSYQDTTYYALLGVMASAGLKRSDVNIQAAGPVGVWQLVAKGKAAGMAGVPDWIPPVEQAGIKVRIMPSDNYFPTMAQAIGVSDKTIAERPKLVRGFVRAALRGMKDIMDDPAKAAKDFVRAQPSWKGKTGYIEAVFNYYAKLVYPGQNVLGEVNADRLAKLQDFYLKNGIIRKATKIDDLYSNAFVK